MSFPFKRILCPVDFDENSVGAMQMAAQIARREDGIVLLMHVVPMIVPPTGMPVYVDLYKGQEETARAQLGELARKHLQGVKYELLTKLSETAGGILAVARKFGPDLIVMATHGRRGISRVLLGSVAEVVLREAACPVLTVHGGPADRHLVAHWMTSSPVTAGPKEKLDVVAARMRDGDFRSMPVVDEELRLVGIVTDRDIRRHTGYEAKTAAEIAMSEDPITVTPETSIEEAARLLLERKIGGLPVVESGRVIGVVTASDVLRAFTARE